MDCNNILKLRQQLEATKNLVKVQQAYLDGRTIQYQHYSDKYCDYCSRGCIPNWDLPNCNWRIKPESKLVPWSKPEHVELGWWIRYKGISPTETIWLITCINVHGIFLAGTDFRAWHLFQDYQYSDNKGKMWKPCMVEVVE